MTYRYRLLNRLQEESEAKAVSQFENKSFRKHNKRSRADAGFRSWDNYRIIIIYRV
jgi:hypothetical protein